MIKNYIKIAWRNLKRKKTYAFISISGLTLGIICSLLIFTLITYHLSFDRFHTNIKRIYVFYSEWHNETVERSIGIPQPLAKAFEHNFNLAEKTARIVDFSDKLITVKIDNDEKKFKEEYGVAFSDPGLFDILNLPLIKGNKRTVLIQNNEALITERIARKYFGNTDPMGQIIRLDNKINFKVTGILKNLPTNTDRRQEIYLSYGSLDAYTGGQNKDNWNSVYSGSQAYTLLKPNVTIEQANNALAQLVKQNYNKHDQKIWSFKFAPLTEIHFTPELGGIMDKKYIWALAFIGLFLIVTASINFVNLATAQALNRSKEVGIRKVLGSKPSQLFWQFIIETGIITFFAVTIAIGLTVLLLPCINQWFLLDMDFNWRLLSIFIAGLIIFIVFLSGSYPGLVLAKFQPILALKNKLSQNQPGRFSLRKTLVIIQFSISQVLIIAVVIVVLQLRYSETTYPGFDKKAIVLLPVPQKDLAKLDAMHNSINGLTGVEKVSFCYRPPAAESNNSWAVHFNNRPQAERWDTNMKAADVNYFSTFGIKFVAGRAFFPSDTTREVVVNETFCRKLNLKPSEVIGKVVSINSGVSTVPIVGVVKDFITYSFHAETSPMCIMPSYHQYSTCAVKIDMHHAKATLASLQKIWNDTFPDNFYTYTFLDDSLAKFYETDNLLLKQVEIFALIAVLIGCLGLYGLVSFMTVTKTKEVAVRKVLGANIQQIMWLFSKEFCILLLIAFLIAAPLAYWIMNNYLHDFAYRITIGPGIFLTTILSSFIIAFITVGHRTVLAAIANPVKNLRNE